MYHQGVSIQIGSYVTSPVVSPVFPFKGKLSSAGGHIQKSSGSDVGSVSFVE